MLTWLVSNAGTLLVSTVLITIVILIIVKLIRNKKKGKSTCGGNCTHCPMCRSCHKK